MIFPRSHFINNNRLKKKTFGYYIKRSQKFGRIYFSCKTNDYLCIRDRNNIFLAFLFSKFNDSVYMHFFVRFCSFRSSEFTWVIFFFFFSSYVSTMVSKTSNAHIYPNSQRFFLHCHENKIHELLLLAQEIKMWFKS